MNVCGILNCAFSIPYMALGSFQMSTFQNSSPLGKGSYDLFLSLDFYKGQEKLDENFMWFKKLGLLNFNKKVATATAYF